MTPVTDPDILAQLNSSSTKGLKPVTDPKILAQLNGETDSDDSYLKNSLQSGEDFITGLGNSINRFPAQLANLLSPKSMQANIPEEVPGLAGQLGGFSGDVGSMISLGGPASALLKAGESIPFAGRAAAELGKEGVIPGMARFGAGAGSYEATMHPEDRLGAGLGGFALGAGGSLAGSLLGKLLGYGIGKTNLSPEQLAENLRIAGDTQTGLGDVIGSPELKKRLENVYGRNQHSGYDEKTFTVQQHLNDKGNEILGKYLGDTHPLEVNEKISEGLKNAHDEQEMMKRSLYNNVEDIANNTGLEIKLPSFGDNIKKYSDIIDKESLLRYEPDTQQILKKLQNYSNNEKVFPDLTAEGILNKLMPNNKGEFPQSMIDEVKSQIPELSPPSLKETNILSSKLNSMAKEYSYSPKPEDRNKARIFGELGRSLKDDIRSSIEDSGNKELSDAFNNAEKNYKENFSPFLDKDIYKFTRGENKDNPEEIISKFLKTSRTKDQSNDIEKLMTKLDPETQNLVKYSYLSRALQGTENERTINPSKLRTLWTNETLGQNQKKALIPDQAERKELDDYSKLVGMNPEAAYRMFNPRTGYRNAEHSNALYHLLGGITGAGVGSNQGGTPGAILGSAIGLAAPAAYARYMTHKLTSPEFRKKFVESLMNKGNNTISASNLGGALASSALTPNNQ